MTLQSKGGAYTQGEGVTKCELGGVKGRQAGQVARLEWLFSAGCSLSVLRLIVS